MKVKVKAKQGLILALTFINMYEEDSKDIVSLDALKENLRKEVAKFSCNYAKEAVKAYNWFEKRFEDEVAVSYIYFIINLVMLNPHRDRYKSLINEAINVRKSLGAYKVDELVLNSRLTVTQFYKSKEK